ncbi:hypothetical protein D1872_323500 [compost metagenome]
MVLLQNGQAFPRRHADFALVRLDLPRQNFQKGRFPRSVGSDQPVTVARRKLYIYIFEKCPFSISERYTISTDHLNNPILYPLSTTGSIL